MSPSISSFVTSLSSSKRKDWTSAKTASLARVNDIRRKETEGASRRRAGLTPARGQHQVVRSRSLSIDNSERGYRRSLSDGYHGQQDVHQHDRVMERSQSANLAAMRAGYHNPSSQQHQTMSQYVHPQHHMHHQQQQQEYSNHNTRSPSHSSFYRNSSRGDYFYPSSSNNSIASNAAVASPTVTSSMASTAALHGDHPASYSTHYGTNISPTASNRMQQKMARIQDAKRQAKVRTDHRRASFSSSNHTDSGSSCNQSYNMPSFQNAPADWSHKDSYTTLRRGSFNSPGSNSDGGVSLNESSTGLRRSGSFNSFRTSLTNEGEKSGSSISVSARTTKTAATAAMSTSTIKTSHTVKSAPPAPQRRLSGQGDWLSMVRSKGESQKNEPIGHLYNPKTLAESKPPPRDASPPSSKLSPPSRGRDVSPTITGNDKNRAQASNKADDSTVFSAASSFLEATNRIHHEKKDNTNISSPLKSLESKISSDIKTFSRADSKSILSNSTRSTRLSNSSSLKTRDESTNTKSYTSKASVSSSFKDPSKVKIERHVSFTRKEPEYIFAEPAGSSLTNDEGSGAVDAPGWCQSDINEYKNAGVENNSDPPHSLSDDLQRLRKKSHNRQSSDDSDATIKPKCNITSSDASIVLEQSVCSSLGSLVSMKRVTFRDKYAVETKQDLKCSNEMKREESCKESKIEDDSFALENLWDDEGVVSIGGSSIQSMIKNGSSTRHQEYENAAKASFEPKLPFDSGEASKMASTNLVGVKNCELISSCSHSDTETLPTVDTSTTPLLSDDYTLDSFLDQSKKGLNPGCKEIKQRFVDSASYKEDQGTPKYKKSESLPLPSRSRPYSLPPPMYHRSRSTESIPSQSNQSSSWHRGASAQNSHHRAFHRKTLSSHEQAPRAVNTSHQPNKLSTGKSARRSPEQMKSPTPKHCTQWTSKSRHPPPPPPPPPEKSQSNKVISSSSSRGRLIPPPPPRK